MKFNKTLLAAALLLATSVAQAIPATLPGTTNDDSRFSEKQSYEVSIRQQYQIADGEQSIDLRQALVAQYPELRGKLEKSRLVEVKVVAQSTPNSATRDMLKLLISGQYSSPYSLTQDGVSEGLYAIAVTIPNNSSYFQGPWQLLVDGDMYIDHLNVVIEKFEARPEVPRPPTRLKPAPARPQPPGAVPTVGRYAPIGTLLTADNGVISGWAVDQDDVSQPIVVHIYADAPATQGGILIASVLANLPLPQADTVLGIPGDHGFEVSIPAKFHYRRIFVHGADLSTNGAKPLLKNSGMTLR